MLIGATEPAMPTEPKKPLIVISYAHADEPEKPAADEVKWLSFVTGYLRPAIKHGAVDLWLDRLMPGGADWEPEIEQKLRACDIFILLVSRHSLSSDYVVDKEIAIIRERQAKGEDVHFYPLVLTPTPKIALDRVRDKNLRPRDGTPLSSYRQYERWEKMNEVADELAEIAAEIASRERAAPAPPPLPPSQSPTPTASTAARAAAGRFGREVSVGLQGVGSKYSAGEFAPTVNPPEIPPPPVVPNAKKGFETSAPVGASPLSPPPAERQREADPWVEDRESLEAWLRGQSREVLVAIAARAALRVLPYVGRVAPKRPNAKAARQFAAFTSGVFRARALARVAGKYPARANEFHAAAAAYAAYASNYAAAAAAAAASAWEAVRADITALQTSGESALADLPLWYDRRPGRSEAAWSSLKIALPRGEDWEVWIDWYEERLRGGSRGEAYELVFATVPQDEWDKGAAAANAWIKAHLPKAPEPERTAELPEPVANVELPWTYGRTAKATWQPSAPKVVVVEGP